MAGRSAKKMVAYPTVGGPVEWQTASDKHTHAGLIWSKGGVWDVAVQGTSPKSIEKRAKAEAGRRYVGFDQAVVNSTVAVVRSWEMTAPIAADYFGHHRLLVTAAYREGQGWVSVRWYAGRSNLRKMQRDGWTALQFEGRREGEDHTRKADFQMTEILQSLNTRRARA